MRFATGHGTGNDFVLLPDADNRIELTAPLAVALCERRTGLGADGVLRVVRDGVDGWFMDHRNADGSIGTMCGNGARLYGRYLVDAGLAAPGRITLRTRSGPRPLDVPASGDVTVDMGRPQLLDARPSVGGRPAIACSLGNPHVVVFLDDEAELAALDLTTAPTVEPSVPAGQNVEFVVRRDEGHLLMRVHERGVGETRSCGSGVCAAVVAAIGAGGSGRDARWTVDVPGGQLTVGWPAAGSMTLTGPAVLVAAGELDESWLRTVAAPVPVH